jgi:hypothetical protein
MDFRMLGQLIQRGAAGRAEAHDNDTGVHRASILAGLDRSRDYSARNVATGSVVAAPRAGIHVARSVTTARAAMTVA